jgi:uncharacterized membrane protein YhaH (DUF805 family)
LRPNSHIGARIANFFLFSGRATRTEYWRHLALCFLVIVALQIFFVIVGYSMTTLEAIEINQIKTNYSLINIFGISAPLIISFSMLAVTARRFQDYGWSGRWFRWMFYLFGIALTLTLIAVIGVLLQRPALFNSSLYYGFMTVFPAFGSVFWTFWIGFLKPQAGPNSYGPNPREVTP